MDLVTEVYRVSRAFPKEERFALTDQIRRAAVSIPSNIAEGKGRLNRRELVYFLGVARGSAQEVATQLEVAVRLGFQSEEEVHIAHGLVTEVLKLLNASLTTLRARTKA